MISQALADDWAEGKAVLGLKGRGSAYDAAVLESKAGFIVLARGVTGERDEITRVVEEYPLSQVENTPNGGKTILGIPSREVVRISSDQYFGRAEVTEEQTRYIEIMRERFL